MFRAQSTIREVFRLLLAAMLVLASLASARLQGDVAGRFAVNASIGSSLCSGMEIPASHDGGLPGERHVHCLLCTLGVGNVAAAPDLPPSPQFYRLVNATAPTLATRDVAFGAYQSRGPPLLG